MRLIFLFFLLFFSSYLPGQVKTILVVDAESGKPLPFVNVLFNQQNRGTSTNIDGYFNLNANDIRNISLSYVGYEKRRLAVGSLNDGDSLFLARSAIDLDEITGSPGNKAAEAIMRKVVKNRDAHQPDELESYRYRSYNKLTFLLTDETRERLLKAGGNEPDSAILKLKKIIDQQYLFLMESVSDKLYQKPEKENEVIIASHVSGLEDPSFLVLATQLQSFTFYRDYIKLFEQDFLSPVSPNSWNKYLFILEEQLLSETGDSLFVIRFQPRKNRNFEGVKGVLIINADGYAIQSVRAEAANKTSGNVQLSIEQLYDKLSTGQWFPKALNAEIQFSGLTIPGSSFSPNSTLIQAIGKTYLDQRQVNIPIDNSLFQGQDLSVDPMASQKSDSLWQTYRPVPLSVKDSLIYQLVDSLGEQRKFSRWMNILESLPEWRLPVGKVDLCLDQIIGLNKFEGLKLGMCLETNPSFSRRIQFGAYWRYGLKDEVAKYGGNVGFRLDSASNTSLFARYEKDVREDGAIEFMEQKEVFISDHINAWYRSHFTYHKLFQAGIEGRIFPSFKTKAYWKNYRILDPVFVDEALPSVPVSYHNIGIQFRLAFKESLFRRRTEIYSFGTRFPVLQVNYEQALQKWSGRDYKAFEFKLNDSFRFRNWGESEVEFLGTWRKAGGVVNLLASPPSSRPQLLSFYSKNTFVTMGINEFVADKMLAVFWQHNFSSLLFRYKQVKPEIILAFNAGIGSSEYDDISGFTGRYPSISKGYYEGGLLISKLLNLKFLKLGIGAFYRMGPYHLDSVEDNLSLKFTIDLPI